MTSAKEFVQGDTNKSLNVYQAIAQVQAHLAKEGITKGRKNKEQGYQFRGIDDVYNALAPILADAQLCILPRMLGREVKERATKSGGTLFSVVVEAEFDFVSAGDGSKHTVKTFGEAMDSGDKATNKAQSAAYKYACLQTFCIPTEGDNDADASSHEGIAPKPESVFDSPELREQFVVNVIEAVNKALNAAGLKDVKDLNLARLNAMKASKDGGDVDGYNRILNVYNPKFLALKEEAKATSPKPTVESVKQTALLDDEIPF